MFYLICFIILLILAVLNIQLQDKLSRQLLSILAAIILICIAGLRYETGGDWDTYTILFNSFPPLSRLLGNPSELIDMRVEEGFVLLSALIKSLGGNVQHLFFVVTTINILLITYALPKYTKYPVVALMCYYGILYFNLEMIYIRQATAVAMCFFAIQFIKSKKIVWYMSMIVLACTFHRVAALMIPLYFILDRQFSVWLHLAIVGVGAIVMIIGIPWIQSIFVTIAGWLGENYADKARMYTENALFAVDRGFSVGFLLNLGIFIILMFFKQKIDALPFGTIMLNMFTLSLILYYYCFELVEVSNRVRLFFLISIIVLLPMVLELWSLFLERLIGLVVITLYCFSFSRGIFLEYPQAMAYNPYQNYIEYKINPRPSTGKQRLEKSHHFFRNDRKH